MRKLFGLLNLLLCFELIVSPIAPHLSVFGQKAFAEVCSAGAYMDSTLNRCLTSAETANVMNATASCQQGDIECYKRNALEALQKNVDSGKVDDRKESSPGLSTAMNIAAIAGPMTVAAIGISQSKSLCKSPSFYTMVAGSLALVVGDNLANIQHKGRLKTIKEDWGKIVNPVDAKGDKDKEREASIEAQSEAFEMLARSEDSLAKAAKLKQIFFWTATLAYGVSATIALLEIINPSSNIVGICKAIGKAGNPENMGTPKTLYSYYSENKLFDFRHELQSQYNLNNSKDLVSFIINQKEMRGEHVSLTEYEDLKESLKDLQSKDPTIIEIFKATSLSILNNLNPAPSAFAREDVIQDTRRENISSGTIISPSKNTGSNAAKAYQDDESKGMNWWGVGIGAGIGTAALLIAKKTAEVKMLMPVTRLTFSSLMVTMTTKMAIHAGAQAKASTERAGFLRKMKDDFVSASGALFSCKSEDRNDPGKPNCYCYTPENQRNSNRTSSQVCKKLWAEKQHMAGNYLAGTTSNSRICITSSGQADPTCACKTANKCMKVGINGLQGINAGSMSMISQSLDPLNKILSGADAASLNSADLSNQALRMNKLALDLQKDKRLGNFAKTKEKNELQLMKDLTKASSALGPQNLLGSSASPSMPTNPGEAARMLEKELESNQPTSIGGGNLGSVPSDGASSEALEFGLTGDQLAEQESQIAEVMKQELDYGGNDINQGASTNIFETLSNRYRRSGMKRLFDGNDQRETTNPSDKDAFK